MNIVLVDAKLNYQAQVIGPVQVYPYFVS